MVICIYVMWLCS